VSKEIPSVEEALRILKTSGCPPNVIKHCKAVSDLAVKIAMKCKRNGVDLNVKLVQIGALLHDLGRSKTHSVHHPILGSKIARSLNLPEEIVRIIERHIGGGLTAEEASELGWPRKNYLPETIEEKIVAYADKLIDGEKIVPIQETIKKFQKRLGVHHPSIKRIMRLHKEITRLCGEPID